MIRGIAVVLTLLWAAGFSAAAADPLCLTIGDVTVRPGATVSVPVSIDTNPGLGIYQLYLLYDSSALTPVSVTPKHSDGIFEENTNATYDGKPAVQVVFIHADVTKKTGELFTVEFAASAATPSGTVLPLTAAEVLLSDMDGAELPATVTDGTVTVSGTPVTAATTTAPAQDPWYTSGAVLWILSGVLLIAAVTGGSIWFKRRKSGKK